MKRTLLLLALSAVLVMVAGSAVPAQQYPDDGTSASPSASATASASAGSTASATASALPKTAGLLRKTGGPPLAVPVVLGALIMVGSGAAAFTLVRRYTSS